MQVKAFLQSSETGKIHDISTLCGILETEFTLKNQAGKVATIIKQDPKGEVVLTNGSVLMIHINGKGFFRGFIVSISTDARDTYKVSAYDQLFYLKNQDILVSENMTASQVFEEVASRNGLNYNVKVPTGYVLPAYLHTEETGFEIIQHGFEPTLANEGKFFVIKDNYGTIEFTELKEERLDIVIGDKSLLTSYVYEKNINQDTYNQIRVFQENEELGSRQHWVAQDSYTIGKWGLLSKLHKVEDESNEARNVEISKNLLTLKNREVQKLTLNVLADDKSIFLKAGNGFILDIEKLNIREYVWIESISHNIFNDIATMQIEVFLGV